MEVEVFGPGGFRLFDFLSDLRGGRISAMKAVRQARVLAQESKQ